MRFGADLPQAVGKGTEVRITGIAVGKVTGVRRTAESATLEIHVEPRFASTLRANSHARARPRIFLEGAYFLDLFPGTLAAPALEDGATIPGR